jgi:hypothetical protein
VTRAETTTQSAPPWPQNWSSPCAHMPRRHTTEPRLVHKSAPALRRTRRSQRYGTATPAKVIKVRSRATSPAKSTPIPHGPNQSQLHSQRNVGPTSQQKGTERNHRVVTEEFPNVSTWTSEHPRAPTRSKSVTSTSVIIGLTPHRRLVNSRGHNYSTARAVPSGTDATDYSLGSGAIPRAFSVGP